jgi:multisubunit Na+/H+ antiporter MnhG subunit
VRLGAVLADVLLVFGVGLELVAVLGVVVMRDALDRLHYVAPASFGALAIGIAIILQASFSLIGDKALLTGAVSVSFGSVVVHTTARALAIRQRAFEPSDGERDRGEPRPEGT